MYENVVTRFEGAPVSQSFSSNNFAKIQNEIYTKLSVARIEFSC